MSRDPIPPAWMTPDQAEAWAERASIMEYDAGFDRWTAEHMAEARMRHDADKAAKRERR